MRKRSMRMAALAAALICLLALDGCGSDSGAHNNPPEESGHSSSENGKIPAEPADTTDSGKEADQAEPASDEMVGSGDLGDFHVEIKDIALAADYHDEPALIVTYAWTNNSDETTSAMVSISEKAFQDGIELDSAIIMDSSIYDSGISMKDVRPGTTIDVQCAFILANQESDVELEFSELFNFSKNSPKVTKIFTFE